MTLPSDFISNIINIAEQAGELIVNAGTIDIHQKEGHANYVTSMDIACQNYLIKALTPLLDADFMAEENDEPHKWHKDFTWIIDPIDGTTNYMRDFKHSCISVALAYRQEVILGVIHDPYLKETFYAQKGQGSYCNGKPIRVSNQPIEQALIIFGTALYDLANADITFETAKQLFVRCADVRRTGSAALDLCYVASGRCDGFFEYRLSPWDYAAGSIIVTEAGGDCDGIQQNIQFSSPMGIIAGNKNVFPLMRSVIDQVLSKEK